MFQEEKKALQRKLDSIVQSDRSFLEKANELSELYHSSDSELFFSLNTDEITSSPLANFIIYEWER